MPTFTFYDLQKHPYKCSELKILRTVDFTVCGGFVGILIHFYFNDIEQHGWSLRF